MRKYGFILLILTIAGTLFAGSIFREYGASPEKNRVLITWQTSLEKNVSMYLILRSADDRNFIEVGEVQPQGDGHNYQFVDENVYFKSLETFFYKIRAINKDGNVVEDTQSFFVNPNVSGIFRTWGAIKAMFR